MPLTTKGKNAFFAALQKQNPSPTTELQYGNNYQLLVAVVLSAQSTDIGVNKATAKLFAVVQTPAQMLKLGEEKLSEHIRTIGLYRTKAKNIIRLSDILRQDFDGNIPKNREDLQALPGVGRKTANVILNTCFGEPVIAVDTHVFRVSNRTGLAPGKTPAEVETRLQTEVPKQFQLHAHHWLILHGRHTCRAQKPQCHKCPIQKQCQWQDKNI
ncbi:MAG: endonuclease III [Gammaproteobacteria bacterium]